MPTDPTFQERLEVSMKHPGVLPVYRVRDAYRFYDEAARTASALCGLTITMLGEHPTCAFPYHQLEGYLAKLVRSGQRVAVCGEFG